MVNGFTISTNNVDIYYQKKKAFAGGIAINVASYLCRAGHKASYCGWVGNDALGKLQLDALIAEGVDTQYTHVVDIQQDWCKIKLEEGNNRVFTCGDSAISGQMKFKVEDVEHGQTGEYDFIYSNIECEFEPDAWKKLGESKVPVCYDFSTYWDRGPVNMIAESKDIVDYFYMSLEGRKEEKDPEAFLKECVEKYNAKIALATLGTKGSILYNGRKFYKQKAYLVDTVDTMGAGDMFLTTFTVRYIEDKKRLDKVAKEVGWNKTSPDYLEIEDSIIERALSEASMCAAANCMLPGALQYSIDFDESMIEKSATSPFAYK